MGPDCPKLAHYCPNQIQRLYILSQKGRFIRSGCFFQKYRTYGIFGMVFSLYKSRNLSPCQKCCTYGIFGRPLQIIFSLFVRGVIWHQAEGYNCNIMSQILSFLTHVTALPVGSISSSHTKISAIYWYHFLVWVLIPLDGAAIDGVMLSIVLYLRRTFLARLFNHICIHFRDDIAVIPLLVPNFSSYKEWEYEL